MRIVFTCGGTAGHINPAVAVARLILSRRPHSEILFIGADGGMETELVAREGFEIKTVEISNFRRSIKPRDIRNNIKTFFHIRSSVKRAGEILKDFKPDAVVGTGGYASFPAVSAASRLGIPTAIHESNAIPGLTTTMLAKKADVIMTGFKELADRYDEKVRSKVVTTGTPVRDGFLYTSRADAKKRLGKTDKPLVVSFWGSLGAREMNKMIAEFIKLESGRDDFYHVHITGSFGWKWMGEYVSNLGVELERHPNIEMKEYSYDMPLLMTAADLVICRGGTATLNEVLVSATPAIIVPSPNVAENHQEKNARVLEDNGGAVMVLEKNCTGKTLYDHTVRLLGDSGELEKMSGALRDMAVLDAGEKIYDVICSLVKESS